MESESSILLEAARPAGASVDLVISLQTEADMPVGDPLLVESMGEPRRLLLSLGAADAPSAESLRRAGGSAAKWLLQHQIVSAGFSTDELADFGVAGALDAFCEGLLLGGFRFDRYKSTQAGTEQVAVHLFSDGDAAGLEAAVRRCTALASGVNLARSLTNEPPNVINPLTLARRAVDLADHHGMVYRVLDETALAELGAGALLAVGQGSRTPPRLIVLEYPGQGNLQGSPPVVVVGKALTFDSGGYMVKDRSAIVGMKYDKAGGAAVLGLLHAAALLRLETPLVGIIPAAENMISAEAFRPDDIIRALSGMTVEITSTDAEGRLVLCDALTYACRFYQPRELIDVATLTYGVVAALGKVRAGLMSNNDALAQALLDSGERTGERFWRLPLDEEYLDLLRGAAADLKNYSGSSQASPVTGGVFLRQFVSEGVPWAHLDILGVAATDVDLPYCPKGATGFGVRLLIDYLQNLVI